MLALAVVLNAGAAVAVAAQDRALPERLTPTSRAALEHLIDSARTAGIPDRPALRQGLGGRSQGSR